MNWKSFFSLILKMTVMMLFGVGIAVLLLSSVYMIPNSAIEKNVRSSYEILNKEGNYFNWLDPEEERKLNSFAYDNFTDSLMLDLAFSKNEKYSNLENAMANTHSGWGVEGLGAHFGLEDVDGTEEYSRYWHGYLVFLKPLLCLFNIHGIRILVTICHCLLLILNLFLLFKKARKLIVPYLFSLFFINPITISQSLQFSSVFFVSNFAILLLLVYHKKLKENNKLCLFFFGIGMIATFFDLLTYPIATFCFPIVLTLFLNNPKTFKEGFFTIVKLAICWGVGYFVFWFAKWAVASIVLKRNCIAEAIEQVLFRVGNDAGYNSGLKIRFLSITLSWWMFFSVQNAVALAVLVVLLVCFFVVNRKNLSWNWKKIAPFLIVILVPFCWNLVLANHTYMHYWYTFRGFSGSIFAMLSMLTLCFDSSKNTIIEVKEISNEKNSSLDSML